MKIYYKDMNIMTVTQKEEFPDSFSFLSMLGGTISLFLGMSFIALFELLEFFIRLWVSGMTKYGILGK